VWCVRNVALQVWGDGGCTYKSKEYLADRGCAESHLHTTAFLENNCCYMYVVFILIRTQMQTQKETIQGSDTRIYHDLVTFESFGLESFLLQVRFLQVGMHLIGENLWCVLHDTIIGHLWKQPAGRRSGRRIYRILHIGVHGCPSDFMNDCETWQAWPRKLVRAVSRD
jgi:hypothetical protein